MSELEAKLAKVRDAVTNLLDALDESYGECDCLSESEQLCGLCLARNLLNKAVG